MKQILEWAIAAIVGIGVAVALRYFVIEGYKVSGESMLPTFQHGDYVFAEKISYKVDDLDYGDIVILETENFDHKKIIKRVIGLTGDRISISDGKVYRNGEALKEDYIQEEPFDDFEELIVPKGEIFVLGDNRNNSSDSRLFGTFTYEQIKGHVVFEAFNNPFTFY